MINGKNILITGGSGSLGKRLIERIMKEYNPNKIIIYSRDELKQFEMQTKYKQYSETLRYFIGDVRDKIRMKRAFEGIDIVIHTAALKQVPAIEYNPSEAIQTNVNGAINVIDCALDCGVKKVVALSTDKAVNPINLYGATKLVSDKLFISANAYSKSRDVFSVVRYGNVTGSRGSVVPYFIDLIGRGVSKIPITDFRMTRFWITLDEAVDLVFKAINESTGGETYISKIPSYKITDLAKALSTLDQEEIGIREGEKLHETMITENDVNVYAYDKHYIIYPNYEWYELEKHINKSGVKVRLGFSYRSDNNSQWLSVEEIKERLKKI